MPQQPKKTRIAETYYQMGKVDILYRDNRGRYSLVKMRLWQPDEEKTLTPYEARELYKEMKQLKPFTGRMI